MIESHLLFVMAGTHVFFFLHRGALDHHFQQHGARLIPVSGPFFPFLSNPNS